MKKIIVAPLNWGLGHATRCIPIINALIENNFTPVIASDGAALKLLTKEFSTLESIELPAYHIKYTKNLKLGLLKQLPRVLKAVEQEKKVIDDYLAKDTKVAGIISDNRFGVRSNRIPSVYLTHQINVLSGLTTFFTSKIHQSIINKFDECWIPDDEQSLFSGKLSSSKNSSILIKYIGVLSRFKPEIVPIKNDILIVLSGLEPHRTYLEKKLLKEFKNDKRKVVIVQGKVEGQQKISRQGNITIYNYLLSIELEKEINQSELIICRSGYSSILDLAALGKSAFFIPTQGQTEQEYLAKYLEYKKIAPFSTEQKFKAKLVHKAKKHKGFKMAKPTIDHRLFDLFEGK